MKRPQELAKIGKATGGLLNAMQIRLFFNKDVLDPIKGVKIYTYDLIPEDIKQQYQCKLDQIVRRIVRDIFAQKGIQLYSSNMIKKYE